jgi:predicted RNA-binding protein with PUA-like domain
MNYWLMKSEPQTYSISDLDRDRTTIWDGVRNYQARNYLRQMQVGDLAFFYHSNATPPGIVGLMRVVTPEVIDRSLTLVAPTMTQNRTLILRAGIQLKWNLSRFFLDVFPYLR